MTTDTVLEEEIAWMQQLVDRIVADEPVRPVSGVSTPDETPAGRAGVLEMEALGRVRALAQASTCGDALFGMLFLDDGDTILIGARTITDASGDPVVIDWRAPVGSRFFQCSVEAPHGVVVRRRVRSRGTLVLGIDDEHLMPDIDPPRPLVGEGALLADPVASDPAMVPVVATLRGDQDRAVRASRRGDTIVVGPPGTGKTVVALNRAAYLDFAGRDEMFERHPAAYLVPSQSFATYVAGVLPALDDASTRLAPMPQFLAELASLLMGPNAAVLARRLDGVDPVRLGSGLARRHWRTVRRRSAASRDRAITSQNGLLRITPRVVSELIRETRNLSWHSSRRRLETWLMELVTLGHPHSAMRHRRDAAAEVANLLLPESSVATIVDEITTLEKAATPATEAQEPSATALGALLMLFVEHAGADAIRGSVSEPGQPGGADDESVLEEHAEAVRESVSEPGQPREVDDEYLSADDAGCDWDETFAVETLAHSLAQTEGFGSRLLDTWLGTAAVNPWAYDHLIIDECQDQAPEVLRALRAAYPAAGRTLVGDLAQSGDPRWYQRTDDLLRAAGSSRHTLHELSHNYRNDRLIAGHVNAVGTSIPGSIETVSVRPNPGHLVLHPLEGRGLDTDAIITEVDPEATRLWVGDASSSPPEGFFPSSEVKGREFPNVVVVVDPSGPLTQSLHRALYVAASRAMHRCDIYLRPQH